MDALDIMNTTNKLKSQFKQILSRLAIASGISLLPVFGFTLIAQAQSAIQNIGGTVSAIDQIRLQFSDRTNFTFDPTSTNATQTFELGNVNVRTNSNYSVTVQSANGALTGSGESLDYSLSPNATLFTGDYDAVVSDGIISSTFDSSAINTSAAEIINNADWKSPVSGASNCVQQDGCSVNVDLNIDTIDMQNIPGGTTLTDTLTYTLTAP